MGKKWDKSGWVNKFKMAIVDGWNRSELVKREKTTQELVKDYSSWDKMAIFVISRFVRKLWST